MNGPYRTDFCPRPSSSNAINLPNITKTLYGASTTIKLATIADKAAVLNIWEAAFHEEAWYNAWVADFILRSPVHTFLDSQGASCLSLIPLNPGGYYLFGLATHPKNQNRGYASRLLDHADAWARRQGAAFQLLLPATPSLSDFYKKRGFTLTVTVPRYFITPSLLQHTYPHLERLQPAACRQQLHEALSEYRQACLPDTCYTWPQAILPPLLEECEKRGGCLFRVPASPRYPTERLIGPCYPATLAGNPVWEVKFLSPYPVRYEKIWQERYRPQESLCRETSPAQHPSQARNQKERCFFLGLD